MDSFLGPSNSQKKENHNNKKSRTWGVATNERDWRAPALSAGTEPEWQQQQINGCDGLAHGVAQRPSHNIRRDDSCEILSCYDYLRRSWVPSSGSKGRKNEAGEAEQTDDQCWAAGPKSHKATGQRNRNRDGNNKTGTELNKHCTAPVSPAPKRISIFINKGKGQQWFARVQDTYANAGI